VQIDADVFANMENYMESVQLKRTTLSLIAARIPEDQITLLRQTFTKIDINGDGQLTIEELIAGLRDCPEIKIDLSDMKRAMQIIDSNQNGLIDYTEFIAACLQSSNYLKENHLKAAFAYFDKDGSGTISKEELRQCLQSEDFSMTEEEINTMLSGVDIDGDGEVDYQEFIIMMSDTPD